MENGKPPPLPETHPSPRPVLPYDPPPGAGPRWAWTPLVAYVAGVVAYPLAVRVTYEVLKPVVGLVFRPGLLLFPVMAFFLFAGITVALVVRDRIARPAAMGWLTAFGLIYSFESLFYFVMGW